MAPKRIFVTGASGCIGHYITEALITDTDHELFLLMRNPAKLQINTQQRPGIHVLPGDLQSIETFAEVLATMDVAILAATSWGGPAEIFEINVDRNLQLMQMLNPDRCEQVIYFSTASILDQQNTPLPEAGEIGTDYIRSKYQCYERLPELPIAPKVTTVFPTLVFGGDKDKPYSHISAGLSDVTRWMGLIRFLKADGSFHFIHGRDIALVVRHLVDNPPTESDQRELVLGNPAMTVNQAVEEACEYLGKRLCFRLPLSLWLANALINLFRIQMADWDRFCIQYRHFVYKDPVNPAAFGIEPFCPTLDDLLRVSGIPPG